VFEKAGQRRQRLLHPLNLRGVIRHNADGISLLMQQVPQVFQRMPITFNGQQGFHGKSDHKRNGEKIS
jgi:hypothetical protein